MSFPPYVVCVNDVLGKKRYFSHLRMTMCSSRPGESFEDEEKRQHTFFHTPGKAKLYVKEVRVFEERMLVQDSPLPSVSPDRVFRRRV